MDIAINLLGGLGLFLFGMNYMGDGLQKVAGSKMKSILAALTKNKFMGLLVGTLVTAVIQSSSATTVMTVGFVNAGLMELGQAVGIIMGANIGTTITAFLVALDITKIATVMVGVSAFVIILTSKKKIKNIAEVVLGFGILFVGMEMMKNAMGPLQENSEFMGLLTKFTNPYLGLFVGFVMTAILQSSSATTGLLIAISAGGGISLAMAYPIIFGQNIGTCVTAMLSSIGANKTAKRAAIIHLLFNIFGSMIFLFVLRFPIELLILKIVPNNVPQQIATAHILFNVVNVIILFPFSNVLLKASELIIRGKDKNTESVVKYIDDRLMATPPIALHQAAREVLHLGKIAASELDSAMEAFINKNEDAIHITHEKEKMVNSLTRHILEFIVKLDKQDLSDDEKDKVVVLMNCINYIERVGDHAKNIAELAMNKIEDEVVFSDSAIVEFKDMYNLTKEIYQMALNALVTTDPGDCEKIFAKDEVIDEMFANLRSNHMDRLTNNVCVPKSGVIFLDAISDLERIGDHAKNISTAILEIINKKGEKTFRVSHDDL
jgi:phosphate:Na+ symporter